MEYDALEAEMRANPAAVDRLTAGQLWAFVLSFPEGSAMRRLVDELVLNGCVEAREVSEATKLSESEVVTLMHDLLRKHIGWQRGGRGDRPWLVRPPPEMLMRSMSQLKAALCVNLEDADIDRIDHETVATFPPDEPATEAVIPPGGGFLKLLDGFIMWGLSDEQALRSAPAGLLRGDTRDHLEEIQVSKYAVPLSEVLKTNDCSAMLQHAKIAVVAWAKVDKERQLQGYRAGVVLKRPRRDQRPSGVEIALAAGTASTDFAELTTSVVQLRLPAGQGQPLPDEEDPLLLLFRWKR